jgi:hypothetical protein
VLGTLVTRRFTDQMLAALRTLRLPGAVSNAIMTAAKEGRSAAPGKLPRGTDAAALQRTVGHAFATGFTSGLHLALWVGGIMLLASAPIALVTIRRTAPHHVAAREVAHEVAAQEALAGAPASATAPEALEAES